MTPTGLRVFDDPLDRIFLDYADTLLAQGVAQDALNLEALGNAPFAIPDPAFIDAHLRNALERLFVACRPPDGSANPVDGLLVVVLDDVLRFARLVEKLVSDRPLIVCQFARLGWRDDVHLDSSLRVPGLSRRQLTGRRVAPQEPKRLVAIVAMNVNVPGRNEDPVLLTERKFGSRSNVEGHTTALDRHIELFRSGMAVRSTLLAGFEDRESGTQVLGADVVGCDDLEHLSPQTFLFEAEPKGVGILEGTENLHTGCFSARLRRGLGHYAVSMSR